MDDAFDLLLEQASAVDVVANDNGRLCWRKEDDDSGGVGEKAVVV